MIRCYNSIPIGFQHRGLHAVRSWTLAVIFVGCDCDVMFEKKTKMRWEVILSSPKFISQISILLHGLPPPAKIQEGRKPIKFPKIAKNLQIPWKNHKKSCPILSSPVRASWLPWFMLVTFLIGWEVILSSPSPVCHDSFWFHVSLGERQYSHHPPLFCWFCFQQAKGQNCWGSRRWVPESLVQQDHLTG